MGEADGETTTNEVCITADDIAGMKSQITDLPNYKAMGTNNKIPAGHTASICRMVCNTEQGCCCLWRHHAWVLPGVRQVQEPQGAVLSKCTTSVREVQKVEETSLKQTGRRTLNSVYPNK